jgi:hypothetical protein
MKKIVCFLYTSSIILSLQAQKIINDANAVKRNVPAFHSISVSSGIDLYLSQGDEVVAVSAASSADRDQIVTRVEDGVLKIYFDWKRNLKVQWSSHPMKAYVSFKNLERLTASGGSDVMVDGTIVINKLDIKISGGSDFTGKVNLQDLKIDASGGSDVNITGQSDQLDISVSGGSDVKGYGLSANTCIIGASGGSDVYITVNKELTANASGGSDIYYKGDGFIRDIRSNSSNIKKVSK